ncbi:MAG TPA: hypothetical protein VGW38_27245 [Chloroflexota bacterium]|nr:hypothetical protein [Chloroflexota bacterium]
MDTDERQDRRDRLRDKEKNAMVVHKVKSPRTGGRLIKIAVRRAKPRSSTRPS